MIKHAMNIIEDSVDFLNPGQVPVIVCDQSLFAVTKIIQGNLCVLEEESSTSLRVLSVYSDSLPHFGGVQSFC